MAYLSTKNFDYHKEDKTFSQEISSLPGKRIPLKQIYYDSCDLGFTLESHITGAELDFVQTRIDTDGEDVYGWRFELAYNKDKKKYGDLKVLIIND